MKLKKLFLSLIFMFLFISPSVFAARKCAKVVVIGDLGSGKTAIFKNIVGEDIAIGINLRDDTMDYRQEDIIENVGQDILHIKLWDTPGLAQFRDEVIEKVRNANMVYFVMDVLREYDDDLGTYFQNMLARIYEHNANCKVVFLFTKYDEKRNHMDVVMRNAQHMHGLDIMGETSFFTSSKPDFVIGDNERRFIYARDIKANIIEYLRQHINEFPEKHEKIIVASDWRIQNELRQRDEQVRQRDEQIAQRDEQIRQRDGQIRQKDGTIGTKEETIRQKEETIRAKDETIHHKQRVIDWYKEHWKSRDWFGTTYCPFE